MERAMPRWRLVQMVAPHCSVASGDPARTSRESGQCVAMVRSMLGREQRHVPIFPSKSSFAAV